MNPAACISSLIVAVLGFATFLPSARGQSETGIIARNRLVVEGTLQGGASLSKAGEEAAVQAIPKLARAKKAAGKRVLAISGNDPIGKGDFASAGDITIRFAFEPVNLPPGAYGRLVVQGSRVVLGEAGATKPARYDFSAIELLAGASIDLAGPVTLTTDGFDKLDGVIGREDLPGWLDLRISGRAFTVGPKARVYGSVYAPESTVRLQSQSRVDGWIVGDDVTLERGGHLNAMRMVWSPGSRSDPRPTFPQRAVLAQGRLERFIASHKARVAANLDFSADIPELKLTRVAGNRKSAKDEPEERLWYFQACSLLFLSGGLDQARIVIEQAPAKGQARRESVVATMTRNDFEGILWAVAREKIPGEAVRRIEADPLLQSLFFERSQRRHGGASENL